MKISQLATLCLTCLLGILPIAASAQPYVISANGSEVTDQKTGLIWRRCIEGMVWDSTTCVNATTTCTNVSAVTPSTFTHQEALQCAATQTGWRLPNIKELSSIADKNRTTPAIDPTFFPATPASLFWSASPYVGSPFLAWRVDFLNGSVDVNIRSDPLPVRLVRAGQ